MDEALLERIGDNPRYKRLVRLRARTAWCLSAVVVAGFASFILTVALDKSLLAAPVGGMVMTWGIPAGFALIALAVISIALFTKLANRWFDPEMDRILAEARS